jgi:O-antigen biosynthesis protein
LNNSDPEPGVAVSVAPRALRESPVANGGRQELARPATPPGSATTRSSVSSSSRLRVKGKFFFAGEQKVYLRGVTFGPFRPDAQGGEYHGPAEVRSDFARMRERGINAIRIYTLPPRWLLDLAAEHDLRVLVGLPWEQHVTFLADRATTCDIERRVRQGVRACANHPAVMGYAVGNEIPAPLVRWYGHAKVEQYLERLYWAAKEEDPDGLVTYVNYPSTEYLALPFLDFAGFNVYLEDRDRLRAYLARLQNTCGDRPLVLGELGLDSLRNGELHQAATLEWQTHLSFTGGCAGLFIFAWTDEWHRGGHDIEDWQFGLTTTARKPKPALAVVANAFNCVPTAQPAAPPLVSVVICSYNGSRTLRSALEAVGRLEYPAYEVIVVDDGSRDGTAALASEFPVRLISIPNGGLSNARNVGWRAAKGEIIVYLDDDAAPDVHWLSYLAQTFASGDYAGVGGPNLAWPEDGLIAGCVDHAPGNPTHVLLTDFEAEHLPGCNMAFRRSCLEAVGGFDAQFRIAGDDVDLCWRLQGRGWKLGFHPAAMVWHHRRGTVRTYWKQQVNYGKAEAMLERKWPEKYNAVGHTTWAGRLYSKGFLGSLGWSQRRIYHGTWGTALFQSVYSEAPPVLTSILMLPEWYLVIGLLGAILACGFLYAPLRYASIGLGLALAPPLVHASFMAARAFPRLKRPAGLAWWRGAAITAWLHFLQPGARLWGRLCFGLTPWRRRGPGSLAVPVPQGVDLWSEDQWRSAEDRLRTLEESLRAIGAPVVRGGDFDRWDLEVRGGLLGTVRLLMVIEEHGDGRQYVRMRIWPVAPPVAFLVAALFASLAIVAALDLEWVAWGLLNVPAIFLVARIFYECANAMGALRQAIADEGREKGTAKAGRLTLGAAFAESTSPEPLTGALPLK